MTYEDPWALTYEDDTAALTDERLAYELLCGVDVPLPNGRLGRKFLASGSARERAARAALARAIPQKLSFSSLYSRDTRSIIRPRKRDCPSRTTN